MLNVDGIMTNFECSLKATCHTAVNYVEIDDKYMSITSMHRVLNSISSYSKRTIPLSDDDINMLEFKLGELNTL